MEKDIEDKKKKGESTDIRQSREEHVDSKMEKIFGEGEAEHVRGPGWEKRIQSYFSVGDLTYILSRPVR